MNTLVAPWAGMTKRKLLGTFAVVLIGIAIIGALGQAWITHSEPYELGRAAVSSRLGVPADAVHLKRLAPFRFRDGDFSGEALFVLCGRGAKCFTVVSRKRDARWAVVDLVER